MGVDRQIVLRFGGSGIAAVEIEDVSTLHWDGRQLWLAADEFPRFERLTERSEDASYGDHRTFVIGDFVDLPEGAENEVDVEGVDRQGDYLWLVGSHSRTRRQVKARDVRDGRAGDLAKVDDQANRHVLIRIALAPDGEGLVPTRSTTTATGEPLTSAVLIGEITTALGSDKHFKHFLKIPSKDNGLDVEGLVAFEDRIMVGLRGPVLRGWASILEVRPVSMPAKPGRLTLGTPPYRKHFLDLDGLGVRDLCRDGDDMLILAGPTMIIDGPSRVYRWHDALHAEDVEMVGRDRVTLVTELPFGDGDDHAEGITLLRTEGEPTVLLVVYDSPAAVRLAHGAGTLLADVVVMPFP